ncbi:Gfo/Idh/MocA family protein [Variovorax ginsengisoli]|jgi:predicted dehydrogenase|uniref:Gfo/Idh/MocA family oxidoreductase n=1 Tax=Variovorax ginsengisoli TaxID=363844 RepID=A0ABT8S4I6_9BURK|nr:Gfo/Idh/MocA family oxidoreductase [Variovorax ginsengisoli]MDN8613096.1 Gfo/Idh/MocA family oxidoreductase [Variovorax ginsengisoli]MDO1532266.1 Gfo/Idh/MocA family oxidoreductase [Variovorax ginsengisoli]
MTFSTPAFTDGPIDAPTGQPPSGRVEADLLHAVVGLGRFGRTHARKLAGLPGFCLRAAVDCSPAAGADAELATLPLLSHVDELPSDIASATVVTSDAAHAKVALALMRRGCHVLVEKPLCIEPRDGALMIGTARQCGVTLSTGHIERFNPVFDDVMLARLRHAAADHGHSPHPFLRFRRFSTRNATAADSILDLMVHDLDLLAWLCAVPTDAPLRVLARKVGVRSVSARVQLGGLVADLESGYDSASPQTRLQIDEAGRELTLDLREGERCLVAGDDALAQQYQDFRRAIHGQGRRIASGAEGLAAVTRALQVLRA